MKIKIDDKNIAAIQAAVEKSNGTATAHTFRGAQALIDLARHAEAELQSLGLSKGSRLGAIAHASSGGSVANAYKYSRITSTATMTRGSSAWFLTSISTSETYRRTAGCVEISLTAAQDAEVTAKFRARFSKQSIEVAIGDRVTVIESGMDATVTESDMDATVIKIHADGDLSLRFSNGDEGNYSREEITR